MNYGDNSLIYQLEYRESFIYEIIFEAHNGHFSNWLVLSSLV